MYRHALPPGFVLKSQKKALEEANKAKVISIEEFLEVEVCSRSDAMAVIALMIASASQTGS